MNEKKLQRPRAKKTDIKVITYELKGFFKKHYVYKGKTLEKHMAQMMTKGYAVQTQVGGGGEVRLFKTFAKVSTFGALGLLGDNRAAKAITITFVKEPDF